MKAKKTTTASLPPKILQYFNEALLSTPMPKFRDDLVDILNSYNYIIGKLFLKASYNEKRTERLKVLNHKFLEIYGRASSKEKELKEAGRDPEKRPFYYIWLSNKRDQEIFRRLKDNFRRHSASKCGTSV